MGAKLSKTAQLIVDINKQNPNATRRGVLIGGSAAAHKETIPITDASAYVIEDLISRGLLVETPDADEKKFYYVYVKLDDKLYYKKNTRRALFARKIVPLVQALLKAGVQTSLAVVASQTANVKTIAQLEKGLKTADKVGQVFLGNLQQALEQGGVSPAQLESAMKESTAVIADTVREYKQVEESDTGAAAGPMANPVLGAYDDMMDDVMGGCGECGYNGGFFGGADGDDDDSVLANMRDYANSKASATKQHLLDNLIGVLKNFNLKVEGKDREEIIKNMLKQLPNGRDRKFKDNADVHTKVCRSLAQAINTQYGSNVIDMDLPAEQICQQVAELLVSIQGDAYTEFLFVRGEAEKVLRNLQWLLEKINEVHGLEGEKVSAVSTDAYNEGIEMHNLVDSISNKAKEQLQVLGNLLNVKIKKIDQDLSELLNNQDKLNKYIENLNGQRGTTGFSKVVTDILNGLGTTAGLVNIIENALKEIGMTLDEYAKMHDIKDFRAKVQSAMQGKQFSDEQLKLFLNAVELLRKNFYRSKDIAEYKNAKQISGQGEDYNEVDMDTHMDNIADVEVSGGVDTQRLEHLDKRIANRKKLRNILVANFAQRAQDLFENIVKSLGVMSKKVGSEIPLSDQLDGLRNIMQRVSNEMSNSQDAYLALLGYYRDAMSKSRKDRFTGDLKMLNSYIETILEMDMYKSSAQYFRDIHTNIKALVELIDKTSDEMLSKFGMGEGSVSGGADGDLEDIIGTLNIKRRSPQRIVDALIDFDYYYRVAQIKQNLSRTTSELDHYVENYERLTTESIAERLKDSYDKYRAHRKLIEDDKAALGAGVPATTHDEALKLIDEQWESAKKFWATVEAVDAYLRHFTDGIMKNPTDIKDIKNMLDDIVVIHDWYSSKNGDEIACAFDAMPKDTTGAPAGIKPKAGAHYYESVAANGANVGKPQFGNAPANIRESRDHLRKAVTNVGALKNLLSIFVYIGNKFGGNELRTKIFLTPAQIYNNLNDFIINCAYTPFMKVGAAFNTRFNKTTNQFDNAGTSVCGVGLEALYQHMAMVGDNANYDMWKQEHDLFYDLIKGLAAKVFTVLGTYELFDRPLESNRISPIRFIIGGDDSTPKVEEEAVELYLRLTLLAQFYKRLFSFDEKDGDNPYGDYPNIRRKGDGSAAIPAGATISPDYLKITLVPDVDGVFSGLIRLIFRDIPHSGEDKYTEDEIKSLVREINLIFSRMKAKHANNTVMETIYEFVGEINRRYGIVKAKEHDALVDEYMMRYDYGKAGVIVPDEMPPISEYAILPGEGDEVIERPSPAQKLLAQRIQQGGVTNLGAETKKPRILADAHRRLLYNFRCLIDKQFDGVKEMEQFNFKSAVKLAQGKLKREQNDDRRFQVVSALIRGVDVYTKVNIHKYLMFHETVISGLNVLSALHTVLTKFRKNAFVFDYEGVLKNANAPTDVTKAMVANRLLWDDGNVDDKNNEFYEYIAECILGSGETYAWNRPDGIRAANPAVNDQDGSDIPRVPADRYKINKPYLLKSIVDLFISLGQDMNGLVEVSFENGKFRLNTSGLRKLIEDLFTDVSQFIELLRPQLDDEFVLKYVQKENPGSYYWLQEQLLEKLIIGRPANRKLIPPTDYVKYDNLDEVVRSLNNSIAWLTGKFAGQSAKYGNMFAELVYHNAFKARSGLRPSLNVKANDHAKLVDFKTNPYEALFFNVNDKGKTLDTRYIFRYKQLYNFDREITFNRSIVHIFNQLVAKYIQAFYDTVPGKIYSGAISGVLTGHLSRAIADQDMTYYDTVPATFVDNRTANITTLSELTTYLQGGAQPLDKYQNVYNALIALYNALPATRVAMGLNAEAKLLIKDNSHYDLSANGLSKLQRAIIASLNATAAGGAFDAAVVAAWANPGNFGATPADLQLVISQPAAPPAPAAPNHASEAANVMRQLLAEIEPTESANKLSALAIGILYHAKDIKKLADTVSKYIKGILSRNQVKFVITQEEADMVYDTENEAFEDNLISGPRAYFRVAHNGNDNLLPSGNYYQYLGKTAVGTPKTLKQLRDGFGNMPDADKDHVLFTSLSVMLKNMATSRVAGTPYYTTDNLGEVSAYMKEKYRALSPYFKCLFKALIARCTLLKSLVNDKKTDFGKFPMPAGIVSDNPWPGKMPAYETANERHRDRLLGTLDAIINGCNDFVKSCDVLTREVGDDARYFELYNNAIKDYKAQNGFDPLMPISSSLHFLGDITPIQEELLPTGNFGEDGFKYLYGARLLLHPYEVKVSGENLHGFSDLVSVYNMTIDAKMSLPADLVGKFSENFAKATRFLFGTRFIRGLETPFTLQEDNDPYNAGNIVNGKYADYMIISNVTSITRVRFVNNSDSAITNRADASIVVPRDRNGANLMDGRASVEIAAVPAKRSPACVYSIAKDLALVLRLTESNSRDDRIKDIVDYLVSFVDIPNTRLDIQNIVDLNLIPINIHALARDIPLAFLYNYAYTFDRLAVDNFYPGSARAADVIKNLCSADVDKVKIDSAKDAFLSSLINPDFNPFAANGAVSDDVYENYVKPMMVGATGNDLGRPKFISDELFGKVLFGEIYKMGQYSEIGPQVSYSGQDKFHVAVKALGTMLDKLYVSGPNTVCLFQYPGNGGSVRANRTYILGGVGNLWKIAEAVLREKPTSLDAAKQLINDLLNNRGTSPEHEMLKTELALAVMLMYPLIIKQVNDLVLDNTRDPNRRTYFEYARNLLIGFYNNYVAGGVNGLGAGGKDVLATGAATVGGALDANARDAMRKVLNAALPDTINLAANAAADRIPNLVALSTELGKDAFDISTSGQYQTNKYSVYLHYLKNGANKTKDNDVDVDASQVARVTLPGADAGKNLYETGVARYNTVLVRQLLFITNLYRLVRSRLQRDLVYSKEVIMRSVPITRNEITELNGNTMHKNNAYENYKNDPRYRYYLVVKRNP
ncbi:polyprotein [Faustovirus]|nr:polyprotein [Faustovirus]